MATPKTRLATPTAKLAAKRRRLQRALATITREENAIAQASAQAYAIIQLKEEVVLVGVSADTPYRIGGLKLQLDERSSRIDVSLRVGNRHWVHRLAVVARDEERPHQIYAEDANEQRAYSSWIYPYADRASAEAHLPKIAAIWKVPSRIAR